MNLKTQLVEKGNIPELENPVVLQELNPAVCLMKALIISFPTGVLLVGRRESPAFAPIRSALYL